MCSIFPIQAELQMNQGDGDVNICLFKSEKKKKQAHKLLRDDAED